MENKTKNKDCINFEKHLICAFKHGINFEDYIFLKQHLKTCISCQKKYAVVSNIINDFKMIKNNYLKQEVTRNNSYSIKDYQTICENISAYIDNETDINESFSIKKCIIKNHYLKENLKSTYKLVELLHKEFESYKKQMELKEKIRNFVFFAKNLF